MNIFKKSLAMFLVLCLLFSAAPVTAFADETDGTNPTVTETTEETKVPETSVPETSVPETTVPETSVPETSVPETSVPETSVPETSVPETSVPEASVPETSVPETSVPQQSTPHADNNPYGLITTDVDADIAPTTSNKPADGTSSAQPFPMNVIGTGHYRIPAFVTTKNGTLVAAADARWHVWDSYDDNGDIDTIVSRSTDNGATWNYSFANYIDNGNTTNYGAATFIDPALAYDGKTIYMIVDLYPGQSVVQTNCTSSSKTGTGYDSDGNLLLGTSATASSSALKYYLSGGKILDATGKDQGYTVDAWFNVKDSAGNSCGNLFDYDNTCGFHPLMTSHLYLTKSTDNGATWSAPVMLNPQIKNSSETYFLVSPGRGVVTSDGTIIFGAYAKVGDIEQASIIYSNDRGETWHRSANSGFTSSEDEIVELSNGTLRMFYRYGYSSSGTVRYVDITKNSDGSYSWGSPVSTSASFNGNVNISAISYSKTAGGKQVILVSCPADTSGTWNRYNGYIYTFTFDGTNMNLVASYDVDSSSSKDVFSYSCLTEQANGSIGMLYEKGDSGSITYINLKAETVTGLTFDEETTDPSTPSEPDTDTDITVADEAITVASATEVTKIAGLTNFVAYNVTLTKNGADYKDAATITIPLNGFGADVELWGFVLETDGTVKYVKDAVRDYEKDTLTFLAPHFSIVGGAPAKAADVTITNTVNVRIPVGETSKTYTVNGVYVTSLPDLNTGVATATLGGQQGGESTIVYAEADVTVANLNLSNNNSWTETSYFYSPDGGANYYPFYARRSNRYYYWGYSVNDNITQINNVAQYVSNGNTSTTSPNVTIYSQSGTEAVPAYTTVSFKGVMAGNTTAVVGTTQYNIHVYETVNITINYQAGGTTVATSTLTVASDDTTVTLPKQVTGKDGKIYAVDKTTLALTDATSYNVKVSETKAVNVTVENTPFTGNTGAQGVGKKISNLIIGTGTTYDLNVEGDVVWGTTSDKITVDQNGSVTGVTATGDDEIVYVTATVNGVIYQLPVTVLDVQTSGSTRTVDFYSQEVLNCTAYYSYQGNDLVEFPEGSEFYVVHSKAQTDIVSFFATPDPGYAVTYANGTGGTYFHVVKNADGTSFGYESSGNSCNHSLQMKTGGYDYAHDQLIAYVVNNSRALTADQVHTMLNYAVAKNCDAMFFFSRAANEANMNSSTTFIAEKLPTFEKTVDGVLPASGKQADYRRYVPGMVATVGEMVYFKITVTLERPLTWQNEATGVGPINYTNAWVEDTFLKGAYLYTKELDQKDGQWDGIVDEAYRVQKDDITAKLNAAWADETQRTIELYLVYTVTKDDIAHNTLFNTADLSYTYRSHYSKGASTQEADATASIDMMGKLMGSIVIDFGLPVTYTASAAELSGATRGSAKYGSVEVDPQNDGSYLVTYTPNQILPAVDTVSLYNEKNELINAFMVYPATTVHYEESFITWDSKWTGGSDAITVGLQTSEKLGYKQHNYGYEPKYANTGASNGTNATTSTIGAKGTFTFTGNGIQVFANSTTTSGYVSVEVKNSKGKVVNVAMVDTVVKKGTTDATSGQTGSHYGLPIVSLVDLQNIPHDTYTVTFTKIMNKEPVYIDGIRVFNTVADSSVFASDLEDNPEFYELRDYVLNAINISDSTSQDYGTLKELATQVYNGISSDTEAPKAVITENNIENVYGNGATAQDLLDNGPKNELYLYTGQTLTFNVTTARTMQIGLKAPRGTTAATISINGTEQSKTIESSVDMFYNLVETPAGNDTPYTISITNTGSSILSVTLLKVCDDPSFAFKALTAADIKDVLMNVYNLKDAEIPTEPEVPAETTKPAEPEVPAETTKPAEPEVPAETTKPAEPEVPAETTKPAEPEVPAETTKPNKPGKPDKPGKPNKPTEPTEPEVPTEPEAPVEPELPTEPEVPTKPENPAKDRTKATLTVKIIGYSGKVLGDTKLSAKGTKGDTHVFTAAEIIAAVKNRIPESYAIVDEAIANAEVVYGEAGQITVQIGKIAKLKVTFVNLLGQKQSSQTITMVQTSAGRWHVSASSIRALSPEGRIALCLLPAIVPFGNTTSIVVPIL